MNNTLDFTDTLCKIKEDCALVFDGSSVHKYIHILVNDDRNKWTYIDFSFLKRLAGDHFDGDGSSFMRIQSDGDPKDSSPHIFAVKRVGV
jgi:hypothetical protein